MYYQRLIFFHNDLEILIDAYVVALCNNRQVNL